jgi:hypothetical protein
MEVEAIMHSIDLRTELYRLRLPIYKVASQVNLHPSRLSLYLNERLPRPHQLRSRLEALVPEQSRTHGLRSSRAE